MDLKYKCFADSGEKTGKVPLAHTLLLARH